MKVAATNLLKLAERQNVAEATEREMKAEHLKCQTKH